MLPAGCRRLSGSYWQVAADGLDMSGHAGEVGVMGYRIARDRENDRRDDDDNGEDKKMQTGDYGRLVSFIGMMYGLSAPRIREEDPTW